MDFPIPPEFWWSTDNLSASIFLQGVDQKILPCGQGRIDSGKINPSLLMMTDWKMMMDDDDDDYDGGGDDDDEDDGDGDDSDDCGKDDNGGNVHCALEGGAQLGPGSLLLQCPPPPR